MGYDQIMIRRLFLVATLVSSCAAYIPQPATLLRIQSAAATGEKDGVAVGASPHLNSERNQEVFQADLRSAGVLPLQIVIRNNGTQTVELRRENFALQILDAQALPPAPGDLVAARLESGVGVVGWTLAFGLAGYLASSTQQGEADNARKADLRRKELQSGLLPPGQSASGFLYFLIPPDVKELSAATLVAKIPVQGSDRDIGIDLPLKDLGEWNEAKRHDRRNP
jgi:hypothetical protein